MQICNQCLAQNHATFHPNAMEFHLQMRIAAAGAVVNFIYVHIVFVLMCIPPFHYYFFNVTQVNSLGEKLLCKFSLSLSFFLRNGTTAFHWPWHLQCDEVLNKLT